MPPCQDITYNGSNGGLFNAYWKATPHTGPTDTGNPAGAGNLTAISTSNDARWNTSTAISGTDNRVNSQMYKFNISNVASVDWFEVVWEGFGEHECYHQVNLSVWNYSASAWELVDWQAGYDNFDRVLGNRRYALPGANITNYVNQTATPNELTVRAMAGHHGGAGHDSGKGQGILTDYVKVVAHTDCIRPEPAFTVDGRKGNWYLWKSNFSGTDGQGNPLNNLTFYFEAIDRTNETAYISTGNTSGAAPGTGENNMLRKVTNCTHAMWLMPHVGNTVKPIRARSVAAPVVAWANNAMLDAEYWYPPYSSAVVGKANTLPYAYNGTAGNGDAPAIQQYAVTNGSDWDAANATWDAPYTVGDNWRLYEFIDADPRSGGDQWMTAQLGYNVTQNIPSFNVSDRAYVNVSGSGKFGNTSDGTQLFNVSVVKYNWSEVPEFNNNNASGEITFYYNDSVENYVRTFNSLRYRGTEDNAIVAYESQDFGRGNLTVTDRGAGQNLDVSLNITNITGTAQKFNALLAVFNLSAKTPTNSSDYLNGYCVYPDVANNSTSVWPYYGAIKTTAVLANGSSETVTWSNVYTLGTGYDYWLWCSGMVYGPWTAR